MIFFLIIGGLVHIKEEFSLVPINPIQVIPTALARNLEGLVSISDIQGHVKTGFVLFHIYVKTCVLHIYLFIFIESVLILENHVFMFSDPMIKCKHTFNKYETQMFNLFYNENSTRIL